MWRFYQITKFNYAAHKTYMSYSAEGVLAGVAAESLPLTASLTSPPTFLVPSHKSLLTFLVPSQTSLPTFLVPSQTSLLTSFVLSHIVLDSAAGGCDCAIFEFDATFVE